MEKLAYLVYHEADHEGDELRRTLVEKAVPALREGGAFYITVNVQDGDVAEGEAMRQSDPPIRAMVSFWMQDADERAACENALRSASQGIAGYLVLESRPMVHEAPVGERSPGMNQVTCISRRKDISYDEFLEIWHTDHRKVAIETQSTFGYVRNTIVRPLTEGADPWTAIVEESFPIEALTSQHAFYDAADDEALHRNIKTMVESCQRFLEMNPMEFTHMSEYYLG